MLNIILKCLALVLLLSFLMGCDDTQEFIKESNRSPEITFTYLENKLQTIRDSVKLSSSLKVQRYSQDLTVRDANSNLNSVFFYIQSGKGMVYSRGYQDRFLNLSEFNSTDGIYDFEYEPSELGYHEIHIVAIDDFAAADTVKVALTVFENIPPTAALSIKPTRIVNKYEYTLDATGSYDGDANFGGEIELYEFQINSKVISTDKSKFPYVFSGEQIVNISLRVQDSDGAWSKVTESIYNID